MLVDRTVPLPVGWAILEFPAAGTIIFVGGY